MKLKANLLSTMIKKFPDSMPAVGLKVYEFEKKAHKSDLATKDHNDSKTGDIDNSDSDSVEPSNICIKERVVDNTTKNKYPLECFNKELNELKT